MHSISPNHYTPNHLATKEFENKTKRYWGTIGSILQESKLYFIQPYDLGYPRVIANFANVKKFGARMIESGTCVEFSVRESNVEASHGKQNFCKYEAFDVTQQGGVPFVTDTGIFGGYMRSKLGVLADKPTQLPPLTKQGQTVNGFVSRYHKKSQLGHIEVCTPFFEIHCTINMFDHFGFEKLCFVFVFLIV